MAKLILFFSVVGFGILLGFVTVYFIHHSSEDADPLHEIFKREIRTRSARFEALGLLSVGAMIAYWGFFSSGIVNHLWMFLYVLGIFLVATPVFVRGFFKYVEMVKEDKRQDDNPIFLLILAVFFWSYGATALVNIYLDGGEPTAIRTVAVDKYEFDLYIPNRVQSQDPQYLSVPVETDAGDRVVYDIPVYRSQREYTELQKTPVRFLKHPGYLGIPWVDTLLLGELDNLSSERFDRFKEAR